MAAIDSFGYLLHAFGTPIQFVGKAITVEALPIQEAVERALPKGWSTVHILSDAKNVIQMLQKNLITSWEIETICEDVWRLM
uniref:RNase H type-1 domain-containing protein n=1 Tax=Solanum tuberosum TaxID=4113 RepID=M1CYH8_SOLTU